MDHQVENHADIRAAGGIGREPMRFDKARFRGNGLEIMENGIEPLDMADLQDAVPLTGQLNQFGRLSRIVSHRFFDQHVFAGQQECLGKLKMCFGGRDDAYGIAGRDKLVQGLKRIHPMALRNSSCDIASGVIDAGQIYFSRCSQLRINARVLFAQGSRATDGSVQQVNLLFGAHGHDGILNDSTAIKKNFQESQPQTFFLI